MVIEKLDQVNPARPGEEKHERAPVCARAGNRRRATRLDLARTIPPRKGFVNFLRFAPLWNRCFANMRVGRLENPQSNTCTLKQPSSDFFPVSKES